jgi:hypothetical protein
MAAVFTSRLQRPFLRKAAPSLIKEGRGRRLLLLLRPAANDARRYKVPYRSSVGIHDAHGVMGKQGIALPLEDEVESRIG